MNRLLLLLLLWSIGIWANGLEELKRVYDHILNKWWDVDGWFYRYDFNQNGQIDYNDWIYISKNGRAYRLLGTIPTSNNQFGWQQLSQVPSDLGNVAGFFIHVNVPGDNPLFSWVYVDASLQRAYKLQGADPNTHYFIYLDIDGDGSPDLMPSLIIERDSTVPFPLQDKIKFTYDCENPYEGLNQLNLTCYSSSSVPTHSSSSCPACVYDCIASSGGAASSVPGSYAKLDERFSINAAEVKIFEIEGPNNFRLLKTTTTYLSPFKNFIFEFCRYNECSNLYDDKKYYLVQLREGCNFDKNLDGVREQQGVANKVILRGIFRGAWIKRPKKDLILSAVSELVYEKMAKFLKYDTWSLNDLEFQMDRIAKDLLKEDLDGDGLILSQDLAYYTDRSDSSHLHAIYTRSYQNIYNALKNGKYLAPNMHSYLARYSDNVFYGESKNYNAPLDIDGVDMKAYMEHGSRLYVLDLNQFPQINVEKSVPLYGLSVYDLKKYGNALFLAEFQGFYKFDLSTKQITKLDGNISYGFQSMVKVGDRWIYLINGAAWKRGDRLYVYDMQTERMLPTSISLFDAKEIEFSYIQNRPYLFIANGEKGVKVIELQDDLTIPVTTSHPYNGYEIDTPGRAVALDVKDPYLYVADEEGGLQIIDMRVRQIIASFGVNDAVDVAVKNETIYLSDGEYGIRILDGRDLLHIRQTGHIDTPQSARRLKVVNDRYLFLSDTGLYVYDALNPDYQDVTLSSVVENTGSLPVNDGIYGLIRKDGILYARGIRHVYSYHISSNLRDLVLMDSLTVQGTQLTDLTVAQQRDELYLSDKTRGLVRIGIGNPSSLYILSNGVYGTNFSHASKLVLTEGETKICIADGNRLHSIMVYSNPPAIQEESVTTIGSGPWIQNLTLAKNGNVLVGLHSTHYGIPVMLTELNPNTLQEHVKIEFAPSNDSRNIGFGIYALDWFDTHNWLFIATDEKVLIAQIEGDNVISPMERTIQADILFLLDNNKLFYRLSSPVGKVVNDTLYMLYERTGAMEIFQFDGTKIEKWGKLKTVGSVYVDANQKFALSPDNRFIYVPNGAMGISVLDLKMFEPI